MWHDYMRISTIIAHWYPFEDGAVFLFYIHMRKIESQKDDICA